MTYKTFSEILLEMCDYFDTLIEPKKIRRDDNNFVYKLLKAIAKGYEVIYNFAVVLDGKFDPTRCRDTDLRSIAKIAGTELLEGVGSKLYVVVTNNGLDNQILSAGRYVYKYSASVKYIFEVTTDTTLLSLEQKQYVAYTDVKGSYYTDAVDSLPVTREDEDEIPSDLNFSCLENSGQLGYEDESPLEFRTRINNDNTRQNTLKELEIALKNLPNIFDCKVLFNQTDTNKTIDGILVPPYHMLLIINGDPTDEIASVVASKGIYPTVQVSPTDVVYLVDPIFEGGRYAVYYKPFQNIFYDIELKFTYNDRMVELDGIQETITVALTKYKFETRHKKYITEAMFYDTIRDLNIPSLTLLDVKLKYDGNEVRYLEVEPTRVPRLQTVTLDGSIES